MAINPHLDNSGIYPSLLTASHHPSPVILSSSLVYSFLTPLIHITSTMSYNIIGSGYRPDITLFSFDSTSAKIHKVSDSKAPENASWLEPGKEGVIYSTSEVPDGEVYSLKLKGEELEITGKRSTKGEEPAHGTCYSSHDVICRRRMTSPWWIQVQYS